MEMTGFLGKKVDIVCKDGKTFSGYVFDVLNAEDSDIGKDCIDIAPLDQMHLVEIAINDIADIKKDISYIELDFRN